jgi:hypothetical protein
MQLDDIARGIQRGIRRSDLPPINDGARRIATINARRNREWYRKNPDRIHNTVLLQKFGITKAAYDALLLAQNGVCAICDKECKSGRRLAVDHCHSTGKVRGLLCIKCNNALGKVDDSPRILRRMIDYLER